MAIIEALSEEVTPISAEERLHAITDRAVAAGTVKRGRAAEHHRQLQRQARHEKRVATKSDLAAIGIKVVNSG